MPSILGANTLSGGYDVANSVRLTGTNDYFHKTPSSSGSQRKFSFSAWVKKTDFSTGVLFSSGEADGNPNLALYFDSSDRINMYSTQGMQYITTRVFRDPNAWYHIMFVVGTASSNANNRQQLYVNGVRETVFTTSTVIGQNTDLSINTSDYRMAVGTGVDDEDYFGGYMAEVVFLDNQSLGPLSFGEFDEDSGIWKPIPIAGSAAIGGTNGFYLDFQASGNLGNDVFGGTDLTEVNLAATDQSTDTCTNNFATFNPLIRNKSYNDGSLAEGNTYFAPDGRAIACSSIGVTSGKWYAEFKATDAGALSIGVGDIQLGIQAIGQTNPIYYDNNPSYAIGYYNSNGNLSYNGTSASYGNSYTDNDIIGVALDMDNHAVYFSKNGTFQNSGDPTSGSSKTGDATSTASYNPLDDGGEMFMFVEDFSASGVGQCYVNFGSPAYAISSGNADADGHGNFEYAVPSGYFALCTKNLAEYG